MTLNRAVASAESDRLNRGWQPRSDREGEFGEDRRQSGPQVEVKAEFVVAAANALHEGVAIADPVCLSQVL